MSYKTDDIELERMIDTVRRHSAELDRIEKEVHADLTQLKLVTEFLETIKNVTDLFDNDETQIYTENNERKLIDEIVDYKIEKLFECAKSYAHTLDINELSLNYRMTNEVNFVIHCFFDALFDEVMHYVDNNEEHAKQILAFLLDCR